MDFDFQWLLIGLPIAFALGWVASRMDLRQWRRDARESPRAYFKGLSLLLNEQQDKAVDAFIEAVQQDPESSELHFALGNLFRRRGEFERAVRVHEHLLARSDLRAPERERARFALAEDFMKAGLFDRAEDAWRALEGGRFDREARLALLALAERSRDWPRALELAAQLDAAGDGSFAARRAHYECEMAQAADASGRPDEAEAALARALQASPGSARAWLLSGQRLLRAGHPVEALAAWDALRGAHPAMFLLVADSYAAAALSCGRAAAARAVFEAQYAQQPAVELVAALDVLDASDGASDAASDGTSARAARWVRHLGQLPSLAAAGRLLALPQGLWGEPGVTALQAAVARAAVPLERFRCAACGFEAQHYFWQCPGCLSWDSFPPQRVEAL
ncbi:MAG: lipopolysaccharide assembly protein LapB [Burkholderiales bacterium]|nr:lipopolysaccharide assembly protein LapB [Burkholderiales bacterium]